MVRTSVGVELCVVQVSENLLDGLDSSIPLGLLVISSCASGTHCLCCHVHLEVSSDEELATHDGGNSICLNV
jgi:ferredoxin